jgi:SAM-dependent methyltransferase
MSDTEFEATYLSGERLYGDDFGADEIARWYADEAEGYADLGAAERPTFYEYTALNDRHAFRHLKSRMFRHALGFGSAYGLEFLPIVDRVERLTIVEPSIKLRSAEIGGLVPDYVTPDPSGLLPFGDATFDLITCFGVLHHIPNVSTVLSELRRVLSPDGFLALRETITSMGDWRRPRGPGLTARERGIPIRLFDDMIRGAGLQVDRRGFCMHPATRVVVHALRIDPAFNSRLVVAFDSTVSGIDALRGVRYHSRTRVQKIRPTSVFYLIERSR